MNPVEAFQYLKEKNLPIILSFPMEEETGHIITGKGLCYVANVHGTSRVTFGKFSPYRLLSFLRTALLCHATFEINGLTFGCVIQDITFHGSVDEKSVVTASIPEALGAFPRRFIRVEPSAKAPAILYVKTVHYGTLSFPVKDISEGGVGFISPTILDLEDKFICCIRLPIENDNTVLSNAVLVYKNEYKGIQTARSPRLSPKGIFYGLELFPHQEDGKKIRVYVMEREREIRKVIQQW
ncbi:MAG: hypothetical protein C0402_08640 [Thermodesulfovibrio sp.]|nr:hypothetical protein [Thermodesulfovibrio sp.]